MPKYVREDQHFFHLQDNEGKNFRVAKRGLGSATYAKFQKLACGGKVKGYDDGGYVASEQDPTLSQTDTAPTDQGMAALRSVGQQIASVLATPQDIQAAKNVGQGMVSAASSLASVPPPAGLGSAQAQTPQTGMGDTHVADVLALDDAHKKLGPLVRQGGPTAAAAALGQKQIENFVQGSAPHRAVVAKLQGQNQQPDGFAQIQQSLQDQAALAQQKAAVDAQVNAQYQRDLAQIHQKWEGERAAADAHGDEIAKYVQANPIEATRLWQNQSTGQKLTSMIAMIAGGIGGAMQGTTNPTMALINELMTKDLVAQKENIGTAQTMLDYYLKRGHQADVAHQFALADAADMMAAKMQGSAYQFTGQDAQARLGAAIGQLHVQADQYRRQAALQGSQLAMQGAELKRIQMTNQLMGYQVGMDTALYQQAGVPNALGAGASSGATAGMSGPGMDQLLRMKYANQLVNVGNTQAFARDPKAASDYLSKMELARQKVGNYAALIQHYKPALVGNPYDSGNQEMKIARDEAVEALNQLGATARFSEPKLKHIMSQLPDAAAPGAALNPMTQKKVTGLFNLLTMEQASWMKNNISDRPFSTPFGVGQTGGDGEE